VTIRWLGVVLALVLAVTAGPASAAPPEKAWETAGFANPASVVWDPERRVLYVSNVNGTPADKDGNGSISKLSADGKVMARTWVTGLDGPKGMAVAKGRLYVADIDRLVVIDTATGKIIKTYPAAEAKFLGDVSVDEGGIAYVSDLQGDSIWRLADGHFEKWLTDPALQSPNGVKAERDRLVVASWGAPVEGGIAKAPGTLKAVAYADRVIRDISSPLGNLGGVESDGRGGYLVSDYTKGLVFRVDRAGRAKVALKLSQGSADIGTIPEQHLVLVPMMIDGTVVAYRLN
jgi:DNA-binding beta-propeller fold protein YncE